ncbi:General secretion pathway protein G [Salinisphaera sp. LB1]|nr:General secretion pathway protein G [Salinisphaera sp. LB1]
MELMLAVAIAGILAAIAYPMYQGYRDHVNRTQAIADILDIENVIARYQNATDQLPDSLADIGEGGRLDPWGHPYVYLRIEGGNLKGKGKLRKDRNLVPLNTDYDLYSSGKDGVSRTPLTAKASRDDIVRANNGQFVGLATDY